MIKLTYFFLAVSALIYSLSFAFGQYVEVKKHNINAITEIRQYAKDFDDGSAEECANAVRKQYIPEKEPVKD